MLMASTDLIRPVRGARAIRDEGGSIVRERTSEGGGSQRDPPREHAGSVGKQKESC